MRLITLIAAVGYLSKLRLGRKLTVLEVFPMLYSVVLLVWPYTNVRLLLPMMLLYIMYMLRGVEQMGSLLAWIEERVGIKRRLVDYEQAIFAFLMVAIVFSYVTQYAVEDFGPIEVGIADPDAVALFEYVSENTDESDVFIFRKPRVLALYAGRSASIYQRASDEDLWQHFEAIDADYLVASRSLDEAEWYGFVRRQGPYLEPVYSNADFTVYRIESGARLDSP